MAEGKIPGAEKKLMCGLLAILISPLALHRFLLGDVVGGIIRIVLNIACFAGAIISVIEDIIYLLKTDEEFVELYINEPKKSWF